MKTPELDKMLAVRPDSQAIGGFLEWLTEQEITLAKWGGGACLCCDEDGTQLMSIVQTKEQLLANYFSIDLAKCEKERRALLDALKADGR